MWAISPPEVVEFFGPLVRGKVFCDVGCFDGTLMVGFSKYASECIGIEKNAEYAEIARAKGFTVITGEVPGVEIPKADVYYISVANPKPVVDVIKKGLIIVITKFGVNMKIDDPDSGIIHYGDSQGNDPGELTYSLIQRG